jgi:hypothetical protein
MRAGQARLLGHGEDPSGGRVTRARSSAPRRLASELLEAGAQLLILRLHGLELAVQRLNRGEHHAIGIDLEDRLVVPPVELDRVLREARRMSADSD